jgi:hypothetical protein
LGMPAISLLRSGLTMGVGPSQIPSDSPLGCLLANLGPLHLTPDLKPQKLIFLCNQSWPQYPLDNASKWPLNGTFNPNILRDLYNFCEPAGKWKELSYIQSFPYLCTKPSLYTFCSPVQILLVSKPVSKSTNSSPKPPPSHVSRLLVLLTIPISSYLPEGFSIMALKQATPCQLWPHGDSGFGELMLPPVG